MDDFTKKRIIKIMENYTKNISTKTYSKPDKDELQD